MPSFDPTAHALSVNRRTFLTQSAYGLGGIALALLQSKLAAATAGGAISVVSSPDHGATFTIRLPRAPV